MVAWARTPDSFSSLPTTTSPSSSTPSSCASLPPLFVLDLADELWFRRSVVPLPTIVLPCFPHFASSSPPDTSTLIAQCMFDDDADRACFLPALLSSSSFCSPLPPLPATDPEQTQFPSWYLPAPSEDADDKDNGYLAYNYGYSSMSESDEDESYRYPGYPRATGEDEEAYHYYTAASDWDDEETYNGHPALSDCEEDQPLHLINEDQLPNYHQEPHAYSEPDDALSGIYDVAVLLKDQHYQEAGGVTEKQSTVPSSRFQHESVSQLSAIPHFQVSSGNDQADMKESLKLWAHAVASTLPWKAAAKARPLL
ncbi:hypothetical protein L7F22_037646 [Adiantum nelumboides]|nr:hypothetical protein [Adiantum nelumboides]